MVNTWAKPVAYATSVACARFIESIFNKHGPWSAVSTNNAQTFCGKAFEPVLSRFLVEHRFCSPSHPDEGNTGSIERFIQTLRQMLHKNSFETTWSEAVP
jgi:hypothetical protein